MAAEAPDTASTSAAFKERQHGLEVKIWDRTERVVSDALAESRDYLGAGATVPEIVEAARSEHADYLDLTDTEAMTMTEHTAQHAALVTLEMPFYAAAQASLRRKMEAGNPDVRAEKLALCHMNGTICEMLAMAPPHMLDSLPGEVYERATRTLVPLGMEMPERAMYDRAVSGMRREVAMLRALREKAPDDMSVRPSTPEEDIRGADIIAVRGKRTLKVDAKSDTSYEGALLALRAQGRVTPDEFDEGMRQGWVKSPRFGHKSNTGDYIVNADIGLERGRYSYDNPGAVVELVEALFRDDRARRRTQAARIMGAGAVPDRRR